MENLIKPMVITAGLDTIKIHNIDAPGSDFSHTSIERILNHVKENFVSGQRSLSEYFAYGNTDLFQICMTYWPQYDEYNRVLSIKFCSSFANILQKECVQDIVKRSNATRIEKEVRRQLREKAAKKVDVNHYLIAQAMNDEQHAQAMFYFIIFCVNCLRNYIDFTHSEAEKNNCTPNYYQFGVGTDVKQFLP